MPLSSAHETEARPRPRIGRYQIVGRIGRGGMGMVYRGLDEALDREVAVKTLTVEGALETESRSRFEVEAKAAARLQHTNIVTVFELGEERGVPFIAMELLPGADLEAVLRSREPLLVQEKLDIVIQILRGHAFAHERGIVHRDIKPSNIRLLDDGTAKIMDFGIAKLGGTHLTRTGMMVGTVYYMSPEQIRGKTLDGRSDVFSVGVILHQLLAGKRPFSGKNSTEVLFKIVNDPAPPLPNEPGGLGPRLQEIVNKALAKDPGERYAGAAQMAEALSELQGELNVVPTGDSLAGLSQARGLIKQGDLESAVQRLRELAERNPSWVEARRSLRAVTREMTRRQQPPQPEPEDYPELDATFEASPTQRGPQTAVGAHTAPAPVPAPRAGGRWLLAAAGLGLAAAITAGLVLLRGGEAPAPSTAPAAVSARVPVRSEPPGALVLVGEEPSGIVTDGELALEGELPEQIVLTFRKPGYQDASRTLRLPLKPGESVSVTLTPTPIEVAVISEPPGAAVTLDDEPQQGKTPLELSLDPQREHVVQLSLAGHKRETIRLGPGDIPAELSVELTSLGPPAQVRVVSSFPIDVSGPGGVLARGKISPVIRLLAGRHTLRLVSKEYFLDTRMSVSVAAGDQATLSVPAAGKISIRANPDNCEILIGGSFVDYPPILDRPIAAGTHKVAFRWPDGTLREELAEVTPGGIAYVMGRKD